MTVKGKISDGKQWRKLDTLRGCFNSNTQQAADSLEKKKKEEEEKREKMPFKIDPPVVLPSEPKVVNPPTKPGHWATASQEMRAIGAFLGADAGESAPLSSRACLRSAQESFFAMQRHVCEALGFR